MVGLYYVLFFYGFSIWLLATGPWLLDTSFDSLLQPEAEEGET
jgi:hypothetical protein